MYSRLVAVAVAGAVVIGIGQTLGGHVSALRRQKPHSVSSVSSDGRSAAGAAPQQLTAYSDKGAPLAAFTFGSRTVLMLGELRTFSDPGTTNTTVLTPDWVRLYPTAFNGTVDRDWLKQVSAQNAGHKYPDLVETATQYIAGAPTLIDAHGQIIASDAGYGPLKSDGSRRSGADFNDFLGVAHAYGNAVDQPEATLLGDLDSTGFLRMVWGYRGGLPLELGPTGTAIPRQAHHMLKSAPGVVVIANTGKQVTDFSRLQAGDIVFFDLDKDDGKLVDFAGMYIGIDAQGHHRFISSRQTADGPTFGDIGGPSILDGDGRYAKAFRAARRF